MKPKKLAVSLALALALPVATTVIAADLSGQPAPATAQVQPQSGYLGVVLAPVPEALRTQLGDQVPPGQGVLIRDVADDSPAAKAGLKAYDILLRYDDQKLFSADQLRQLVQSEGPDKTVTLQLVRGGQPNEVRVTLGQPEAAPEPMYAPWMMLPHGHRSHPMQLSEDSATTNWESFDSLSLKKLEDGRFKAEIQYLTAGGGVVKHEFTGTREEIREQILRQKDLPPLERQQLLDAVASRDQAFPFGERFAEHFFAPPRWFNWQPDF